MKPSGGTKAVRAEKTASQAIETISAFLRPNLSPNSPNSIAPGTVATNCKEIASPNAASTTPKYDLRSLASKVINTIENPSCIQAIIAANTIIIVANFVLDISDSEIVNQHLLIKFVMI